jgi:tRNA A64-2'-O-ribosylphosphate transferase
MPDALSTTIPIWCTVLNLALLPSNPLSQNLFLPPSTPSSIHAQITALIPTFLSSLKALNLTLPTSLSKPLRPLWVTQDSPFGVADDGGRAVFDEYRPVICCTASRRVVGSEMDEGGYIQGAGDDTENWACGLTPVIFWKSAEKLLSATEAELPDLIHQLVQQHEDSRREGTDSKEYVRVVQLAPNIAVQQLPVSSDSLSGAHTALIALTRASTAKETWHKSKVHLEVGLGKSKVASRSLRQALPDICAFASTFFATTEGLSGQLLLACDTGRDLSVGTALALSCYLFDDHGLLRPSRQDVTFTKSMIKSRLGRFMTVYPEANPSRTTLQSVNSFLMDWQK